MSDCVLRAIEPVDVIHLRGNRLFEGSGDGVAIMPPWPSLFAGALRSHMLAQSGAVRAYVCGEGSLPEPLRQALGPSHAARSEGRMRVAWAGFEVSIDGKRDFCMPAPADLVCFGVTRGPQLLPEHVDRLRPGSLDHLAEKRLVCAGPQRTPALREFPLPRRDASDKPSSGWFLRAKGIAAWQAGECPPPGDFIHASSLWADDPRLGIAIDRKTRTVRTGLLYTSRAIALRPGVRFCVGLHGVDDSLVPRDGLLRLGGDGRGATIHKTSPPETAATPPWARLPSGKSDDFVLWLVTPGAFPGGWRLPGRWEDDGTWRPVPGFAARLRSAVVGRYEVVSGWSLADGRHGAPKPALRIVPAGSVYWFRRQEGSFEALRPLLGEGLGNLEPPSDEGIRPAGDRTSVWRSRAQEGFGSVWFGDVEA